MKKELIRTSSTSHWTSLPKRLHVGVVGLLALSTLILLLFTLEQYNPLTRTQIVEDTPIPTVHQYDIDALLSNHSYYDQMYQVIETETESAEAAEIFILYLEALKQGDINELQKYTHLNQDFKINPLINDYKSVDFETIGIVEMIPSQAEPTIEVQVSYQRKEEEKKELRMLYLNLYEGNVSVDENFKWDYWNNY